MLLLLDDFFEHLFFSEQDILDGRTGENGANTHSCIPEMRVCLLSTLDNSW